MFCKTFFLNLLLSQTLNIHWLIPHANYNPQLVFYVCPSCDFELRHFLFLRIVL